jgi:hypothetical protein
LALRDDQRRSIKAFAEHLGAARQQGPRGGRAVVDDLFCLTQSGGKGVVTCGVVDDRPGFDDVSDRSGERFDQDAVKDRLARVVGEVEDGVGLGQSFPKRGQPVDGEWLCEHPRQRRLQLKAFGHPMVDDVAGNCDAHGSVQGVETRADLSAQKRKQHKGLVSGLFLYLAVRVGILRPSADQPMDGLRHFRRRGICR